MTVFIAESPSGDVYGFSTYEKALTFANDYIKFHKMDVISVNDVFHIYELDIDL